MKQLAQLPAAPSAAFSLNLMDWRKLLRMALVLVASGFVTTGAPWLLHFSYVIHGVDFTPVIINDALGRRAWLLLHVDIALMAILLCCGSDHPLDFRR